MEPISLSEIRRICHEYLGLCSGDEEETVKKLLDDIDEYFALREMPMTPEKAVNATIQPDGKILVTIDPAAVTARIKKMTEGGGFHG